MRVEGFLDALYGMLCAMEDAVNGLDIEIATEEDEITALIKTTQQQTTELIKDSIVELFMEYGLLAPKEDYFDDEIE